MFPAKIRGLNRDTSDESNDDEEENPITKEALEQKTQQSYKEALVLQKQNKLPEAEKLLRDLLQSEVLVKSNGKVKFVNGRLQPSLFHLKYCCYLNLGNILFKTGNYSAALENYLQATELDDTDLNLWFKIGTVASKIPNLLFAVHAYSETLRRNERHWPSLDAIITATYATGDFMACLLFICHSLKLDDSYKKGLVLRDLIFKEHPFLRKDFEMFYPDCSSQLNIENIVNTEEWNDKILTEVNRLKGSDHSLKCRAQENEDQTSTFLEGWSKAIKSRSWLCLGKFLLKFYNSALTNDDDKLFFLPVKLNSLYSSACVSSEIVGVEPSATTFDGHLVGENGENDTKTKLAGCTDEVNADDDDEVSQLVNTSVKNNEADRENVDGNNKSKRRKCSPTLADQLKICDKRRSTRNKTVLKSNEPSLSKTLQQLIPQDLLPQKYKISENNFYDLLRWNEDSFDTMDIYQLLFEHQEQNSIPSYPINQFNEEKRHKLLRDENYFGTDTEKKDVDWFVRINNEQTILELFEAYLKDLAAKWCYTWPSKLADIYIGMYQRLQKHGFLSDLVKFDDICETSNGLTEESIKTLRDRLNMAIVYGELLLNQSFESAERAQALGNCAFGGDFSSLLIGDMHDVCSLLEPIEKKTEFWMRTYWLEALIFLHKKDIFATCSALSMLIQEIPDPTVEIRLPNVRHFHVISLTNAKRLLNTLNRNQNLNEVKPLLMAKQYDRVADILRETLTPDFKELMNLPNEPTLSRHEQYNLLLTALYESENYEELFKWCEICFYEAFVIYRKSFFDEIETETKSSWASLAINTLNCMFSCLKTVGLAIVRVLQPERLSRLVQTLSNLVCHQIEASEPSSEIIADVVTPWILLANLIQTKDDWGVSEKSAESSTDANVSPSLSLLFIAHEHLGRRSWCCFNDGALLFYTLNVIEVLFKNHCPSWSEMWTTLSQQTDQIFYCLYSHPFKKNKPRHVQDHNTLDLALTWNRAVQAYLFYRPSVLPTFDAASKFCSISGDTETLLKRMISLIPENRHPARFVDHVHQYLCGEIDVIPENGNPLPDDVADLFYLLGDYYFKNKIMGKAIKYYLLDICSNPRRMDSWSAMALARGSQLETKFNSCETISSESDILKKAELTDKCYKTALDLDSTQSTLWIEYGVFCYAVHAFCSRLLKQETTYLSLQMFQMLENRKEKFLNTSYQCFNSANEAWLTLISKQEDVQDERWLHHYMLGKIDEKREEKVESCLNHYYQASDLLFNNGAEYPSRILYSSPQYYSVEALEIYYRVHSSILKILEVHEEKSLDSSTIDTLKMYVEKMAQSPFMNARIKTTSSKSTDKVTKDEGSKKQNPVTQDSNRDVHDVMEEIIDKVVSQANSSLASKRPLDDSLTRPEQSSVKKFKSDAGKNSNTEEGQLTDVQEDLLAAVSTDEEDGRLKMNPNAQTDVSNSNSPDQDTSSDSSSCDSYSESSNVEDDSEKEVNNRKLEREALPENRQEWQETRQVLIKACVHALEECSRRFPEHYKSFYRLAHHYFRSKLDKDIDKARKLLVEEGGLFADRTSKNFFGGIWRIPTGEIDRPGSFAFHMSRSVHLLMDVLRDTQDYKTLLQLSDQLRCKPDLDKKYLRDNEREQLSKDALSLSAQALRKTIDRMPSSEKEPTKRRLLLDVYKCYLRVSKNHSQRDGPFGQFLRAIYCKYTMRKEKVGLEQVLSFCKSVDQIVRNEPAANVSSLLEKTIQAESEGTAVTLQPTVPFDARTQMLPVSSSVDPKTQSTAKAKISSSASFASSIPANLQNLPSAITVTTVPATKMKVSEQPPPVWEKNASKSAPTESAAEPTRHCVIIRTGSAHKDRPRPPRKELNNAASTMCAMASGDASSPDDRSPPKPREPWQAIELVAERGQESGLTIVPVMVAVPAADKVAETSSATASPQPSASSTPTAGKGTFASLAAVNKERPSLIITPVPTSKGPTLQQKLAAKQLASSASARVDFAAAAQSTHSDRSSFAALQRAKQLGSSGVCIFPVTAETAGRSGNDESPNHNPILNRYVSRESEILSHFHSSGTQPTPPAVKPSSQLASSSSSSSSSVSSSSSSSSSPSTSPSPASLPNGLLVE